MNKISVFGFVICAALVGSLAVQAGYQQEQQQDRNEQIKSEARKLFMRGKLLSNQQIVEGLTVKDFDLIAEGTEGVVAMVKGQHWFVLNTPEYRKFSDEMEASANRLQHAAESNNIESAALRYFDLTLTCIDCHQYIETQKY